MAWCDVIVTSSTVSVNGLLFPLSFSTLMMLGLKESEGMIRWRVVVMVVVRVVAAAVWVVLVVVREW